MVITEVKNMIKRGEFMRKYLTINDRQKICYDLTNLCPICNKSIMPIEKSHFYNSDSNMYFFTFQCPACNKGFIAYYDLGLNHLLGTVEQYFKRLGLEN